MSDQEPVSTSTEDQDRPHAHTGEAAAAGGVTGAALGAVAGGPVGAAIGAVAGAVTGAAAEMSTLIHADGVPEPAVEDANPPPAARD